MEIQNKSKKYYSSAHLVYSCQYHVIFCPKYRRKILKDGIDTRMKELVLEIANDCDFKILDMEVMSDHVHLLIYCNPRYGILNCVKHIKQVTSHILKKEFPIIKSKIPTLWTRSSFISSVGSVSLETVKQYIENQKGK